MNKQYLIELQRRNSIIALIASFITLICCLYSVAAGIMWYVSYDLSVHYLFQYFTQLSGIYCGFISALLIPYAIDGFRKKRFVCSKWLTLLHYSGVICTTLVFVFTLTIISWYDPELAFGEYNILLHIACPLLILIAFHLLESHHYLSFKDSFLAIIPIIIYMIVYVYNVVITKRWEDLYGFTKFAPFYVSALIMIALSLAIALLIRYLHNLKINHANKRIMDNWDNNLDPIQVKIEVYGLGRYNGLRYKNDDVSLNIDILRALSKKYNIKLEELTKAYTKGVLDGLEFN